jgi:hypothetical protein
MTTNEYAPWTSEENGQRRLSRLNNAIDKILGPIRLGERLPDGDPRRPRLKAMFAASDRLELTLVTHNGERADLSFAALWVEEKAELCEEVFKVLELTEDGKPGNDWNADTFQRLGQAFERHEVRFTPIG